MMSDELYGAASVSDHHKRFRPLQSTAEPWSVAYNRLRERLNESAIWAIIGKRGTGKTQMAACLVGHCAYGLKKTCTYCKSMDIFLKIRESMSACGDSEYRAVNLYVKPFLLVIDAYEVRSDSEFENRTLNYIVDKRYDSMRVSIIISNDSEVSLRKSLGPSICSRMTESGGILETNWKSFRDKEQFN